MKLGTRRDYQSYADATNSSYFFLDAYYKGLTMRGIDRSRNRCSRKRLTGRRDAMFLRELNSLLDATASDWQQHIEQLKTRNGGKLTGIVKSCLPQPTRPKFSPVFKNRNNAAIEVREQNNPNFLEILGESGVRMQVYFPRQKTLCDNYYDVSNFKGISFKDSSEKPVINREKPAIYINLSAKQGTKYQLQKKGFTFVETSNGSFWTDDKPIIENE